VEAVVLQALGDVNGLDAGRLLEGAGVDDELVRAAALVVGVEDGVVVLEARQEVVGVEEGDGGGLAQTGIAWD
jgi:hypothetical protein